MVGYIYAILCSPNNKIYIGSTARTSGIRKNEHWYRLRAGKHPNVHMQNSWNKYGESSFSFLVIDTCSLPSLSNLEWHYVNITGCYNKEIGFNTSKITDAPKRGTKQTEEFKKRVSDKLKGRQSPNKGKKYPNRKIKRIKKQGTKIINLNSGTIYETLTEFLEKEKIARHVFYKYVGKSSVNGISFTYYSKKDTLIPTSSIVLKNYNRKVVNLDTGEIYENTKVAADSVKASISSINGCILGRSKVCKGYRWGYL